MICVSRNLMRSLEIRSRRIGWRRLQRDSVRIKYAVLLPFYLVAPAISASRC